MRSFIRLLTLAVSIALAASTATVAAETPADPLAHLRGGHPRLLLTDAGLAAAVAAAKNDPLRAALHARIVAAAASCLSAPPLVHRLIGPRMLDQSRAAIERIVTCAMAYRLTGDIRFADRAKDDMLTAAAFADWNPSHFLDIAEMSFAVGIGYDWLYPQLSPDERLAIKRALLEKSLVFAPAAYAPGGPTDKRVWFVTARHNWNQVCNGGLLTAALALADEEPALARLVVNGARASLPLVMAAYQPDGAYPEGPGYWSYGTTYNVITLALLEGTLGTDFGLGAAPAFDRTALYRLAVQAPTGLGFNYADASPNMEDTPAYVWLAQRYHHPVALEQCRTLLREQIARKKVDRFFALYAIWYPDSPAQSADESAASKPRVQRGEDGPPTPNPIQGGIESLPLDLHFRGVADIALFRSAWNDPRALFLAFKAGSNSANHAHLDLGSFVLEADGVRWALDLGPDDYNLPGYFGVQRWSYFRLNNHSHNTVTPGDALQKPKAVAPIIAFATSPARAFAVADLSAAYPRAARRIQRGVAFLDRSRVLVQDEFTAVRPGTPVHWVMVTGAKISLSADGRTALLEQGGRQLRAEVLAPAGARFGLGSTRPPTAAENQNTGTAMLALDSAPSRTEADLRLAVLLTPVGDRWPRLPPPDLVPLSEWR